MLNLHQTATKIKSNPIPSPAKSHQNLPHFFTIQLRQTEYKNSFFDLNC